MMTTQAEIQMFGMASRAVRRDCEASGSRLQDRNSMPNLSNSPAHRLRCATSRLSWSIESTQALYHESDLPKPRARRASAPARAVLKIPLRKQTQTKRHDQARLGASERATRASGSNRPLRPRKSPPTLRIITSRSDLFCSDDTEEISSIAHLSSRSHVYHSSGTEMTDVVRATPSTSLGEPSAAFPRARSPAQGAEALEGDPFILLPFASACSLKQQGTIRDPPQASKAGSNLSHPYSVDRLESPSSTVMTVSKSPRNVKASRRHLFIELNEHKRQSLLQYDDNECHDLSEYGDAGSKPSSPISSKPSSPVSLRHPQFRTLRRKKHFDIARSRSDQDEPTPEPIAISLTLRSPAAPKSPAPSIPKQSSNTHSRKQSDPQSIATTSDSTTCTTPPSPRSPEMLTPLQRSPFEPSTSPTRSISAASGSSPFTAWTPSWSPTSAKFGHPSRPYYTAIRKQGISPPSSRPPSTSGFTASNTCPSSPPSSRPKSSPPPPLNVPASSSTAGRHLSLSAMPPRHMGFVSAFSLELEDSDDDEDPLPLPPTPAPIPANFSFGQSLASAAKRLSSRKSYANLLGRSSHPPPSALPSYHQHGQSHSISYSPMEVSGSSVVGGGSPTRSVFRVGSPAIGLGFSMSGETELRLALARADAEENGTSDDGEFSHPYSPLSCPTTPAVSRPASPPVTDRMPPPTSFLPASSRPNLDTKMSFKSRVKKLRKGLKHMLMNTQTTSNPMHNTMNTATPATISTLY